MKPEGLPRSLYRGWRETQKWVWRRVEWNERKAGNSSEGVEPKIGDTEGAKKPVSVQEGDFLMNTEREAV